MKSEKDRMNLILLSYEAMGRKFAESWWITGNVAFDGKFPDELLDSEEGRARLQTELESMIGGGD